MLGRTAVLCVSVGGASYSISDKHEGLVLIQNYGVGTPGSGSCA